MTQTLSKYLLDHLNEQINKFDLQPWREQIEAIARPAFLIPVQRASGEMPIGATRLGGTPDLPHGFAWPVADSDEEYEADDPQFLTFIGQVNIADVKGLWPELPETGVLSFFATAEDAENPNCVLYFDESSEPLIRYEDRPDGTYADDCQDGAFDPLEVLEFVPVVSLPGHCDWVEGRDDFVNEGHADRFDELSRQLTSYPEQREPVSRIGGHVYSIHGGEADDDNWQSLLQVESYFSDGVEMNFWDAGFQKLIAQSLRLVDGRIPTTRAVVESM